MILLFVVATTVLGGYSFGTGMAILLKLQPPIFLLFCFIILFQIRFYGVCDKHCHADEIVLSTLDDFEDKTEPNQVPTKAIRRKAWIQATLLVAVVAAVSIGAQVGLYFLTINAGPPPNATLLTLSLIAPITAFLGFVPQFWEIYKLKRVVGVSLLFLAVDFLGGAFNIVSLVFFALDTQQQTGELVFDVPALTAFAAIAICDLAILIVHPILERRYR